MVLHVRESNRVNAIVILITESGTNLSIWLESVGVAILVQLDKCLQMSQFVPTHLCMCAGYWDYMTSHLRCLARNMFRDSKAT